MISVAAWHWLHFVDLYLWSFSEVMMRAKWLPWGFTCPKCSSTGGSLCHSAAPLEIHSPKSNTISFINFAACACNYIHTALFEIFNYASYSQSPYSHSFPFPTLFSAFLSSCLLHPNRALRARRYLLVQQK
jgi:hypothetical protein